MEEIRERLERLKIKAEILLKENKKTFIIDTNNSYFFCDILIIGEERITFIPFKGNNSGEKVVKYWADIVDVREYEERGEFE